MKEEMIHRLYYITDHLSSLCASARVANVAAPREMFLSVSNALTRALKCFESLSSS